jgi:hypothetical protein
MRKAVLLLFLTGLLLTACAPGVPTLPPDHKTPLSPAAYLASQSPAARATRSFLAGALGVPEEEVSVLALEKVNWPDTCLGAPSAVPQPGCTAVETPGYRVLLQSGGVTHEFHTNESGSMLLEVPPADATPVP